MLKYLSRMMLVIIPVAVLSSWTMAQNLSVFIWNNDNSSHYIDPESGQDRACEYGLQQALDANDISYNTSTVLPNNLSNYDIVFVELGIYCVS